MKTYNTLSNTGISFIVVALLAATGCSKSESNPPSPPTPPNPTTPTTTTPTVITDAVSKSSSYQYHGGWKVTENGGLSITEQGVCWSMKATPTKADSIIIAPSSTFPRLTAKVTYYVRAFATNAKGTSYEMKSLLTRR